MQLRDNYALGAVNDECSRIGHQWDFAHIDFLLFDILNGLSSRFLIIKDQPYFHS